MIIAIVGPTGIGKSKLGVALAKHLNTEVISGDSIQIYKGLDIGTAKITPDETEGITHHMIDILEPNALFSVALYQELAREKIAMLQAENKQPLLVGGTGFYIKSVLYDFDFTGAQRPKTFDDQYENIDNKALHDKLMTHDSASANTIHPNNRKRVLQALYRASIAKKRSAQSDMKTLRYPYLMIGLRMDRKALHQRINDRIDTMFEKGLIEEVRKLYEQNIQGTSVEGIGYKELYAYFAGDMTLEDAKKQILIHTRQYAKKQYTYFKNQFDVHWLDVKPEQFEDTIDQAIALVKTHQKP